MKTILLTRGFEATVDDADFTRVASLNWAYVGTRGRGHAGRFVRVGSKISVQPMSNFILGVVGIVDHKNGNRLDNRRRNLRPCSQLDNNKNKSPHKRRTQHQLQQFKGVYYRPDDHGIPRKHPYFAMITSNYKQYGGGYHATPEDAARAYDRLARKYHKQFARPNFPSY